MEKILPLIGLGIVFLALFKLRQKSVVSRRQRLIDSFRFPTTITTRVIKRYPHLTIEQAAEAIDGLREYFHLCNIAGRRMVAMPSQVVDVAWHEFILFTRNYEYFCRKALGRFLHHTPAEAMPSPTQAQTGIRTAWRLSCARENIQPKSPHKLPILFALDDRLSIPDGFSYVLDCKNALDCKKSGNGNYYCAGHIGCGSGCSGGCGGDSSGSDSSGCGGGCGGGD